MRKFSIRWPQGKTHRKLVSQVKANAAILREGNVLAIDPSSGKTSPPGYSYWEAGSLLEYGDVKVNSAKPVQQRLGEIVDCLVAEFPSVDVLVIEQIRGQKAQPALQWSIGALLDGFRPPIFIEVPLWSWKAVAKSTPNYTKRDDLDAVMIGSTVMCLAGIQRDWLEDKL